MSWPLTKLDDIFDIARGGSPRPIQDYITDNMDGINWISISDASNSSKYIEKTKKKIKKEGLKKSRLVSPGDFLLTNSMSFGRPYIMRTSGCIHDGWLVLSPKSENIDTDYFYHLLGSAFVYKHFCRVAAGAVVKNLNIDLVKVLEIPLPPLAEQKRIAAILDKADSLRRKNQQAIQLGDQFLRAVFLDMFGDPVTNPKGWDVKPLGDVAPSKPIRNMKVLGDDEVWLLNLDQVESNTGKILNKYVCKFSEVGNSTSWFDSSHILYSKLRPYLNKVVLPKEIGVATTELLPLRPNPDFLVREYLVTYLQSDSFVSWANGKVSGAKMPRLSTSELWKHSLPIPPLELQTKFAKIYHRIAQMNLNQQYTLTKSHDLFSSLSQKAFAGEL